MVEMESHYTGEIPTKPFLAYTRKRGWCVAVPLPDGPRNSVVTHTRPGGAMIIGYELLAAADLPPVPDAAL